MLNINKLCYNNLLIRITYNYIVSPSISSSSESVSSPESVPNTGLSFVNSDSCAQK